MIKMRVGQIILSYCSFRVRLGLIVLTKNATYLQYFLLIFQEENHNIFLLRISLDSNPINSGIPYLLGFVILSDGLTVTYKISSGLRPLMSGKLINYDATMYASTMYLLLIKISSFLRVFFRTTFIIHIGKLCM